MRERGATVGNAGWRSCAKPCAGRERAEHGTKARRIYHTGDSISGQTASDGLSLEAGSPWCEIRVHIRGRSPLKLRMRRRWMLMP